MIVTASVFFLSNVLGFCGYVSYSRAEEAAVSCGALRTGVSFSVKEPDVSKRASSGVSDTIGAYADVRLRVVRATMYIHVG